MSTTPGPTDDAVDDRETLAAEVERLRERVADLEEVVEDLTDDADDADTSTPTVRDHRDAAVLEALTPGDRITSKEIAALYRARTDLQREETIEERLKALVDRDAFEQIAFGKWRYRPGED